jgi:nickel-dependent lactate racemase
MVDVWLPYGKTDVCIRIPARNFVGSIEPKELAACPDAKAEVERALAEPVPAGFKRLGELVQAESKVAIVVDDHTRKTPSAVMLLPVLDELNRVGVKDDAVTVIFGCGTHRAVTSEEASLLLGDALGRVKTESHNCKAPDLVYLGTTKHGNRIMVNRVFAEADFRVILGDVGFHYYAGYGGGRKSVLPAVAGEESIKHNHALMLNSAAHTGALEGNPVHEDMAEAAQLAKVDFAVNVITNSKCEVVRAFAGEV